MVGINRAALADTRSTRRHARHTTTELFTPNARPLNVRIDRN